MLREHCGHEFCSKRPSLSHQGRQKDRTTRRPMMARVGADGASLSRVCMTIAAHLAAAEQQAEERQVALP